MSHGIGPIRSKSRVISQDTLHPPNTVIHTYPGNVFVSSSANPSFVGPEATEELHYSTRPGGSDYRSPAYCRHSKRRVMYGGDASKTSRVFQPSASPTYVVDYGGYHLHSLAAHSVSETLARSSFGVNMKEGVLGAGAQQMINQVFIDLRPDLTTMSLPNFLYEIGQIKDLFKLWKRNVSLAKNLAGARLNYKFGWKPTFGDLQAAIDGLREMSDKIAAFEKAAGVVQRRQERLLGDTTNKSGTFNYLGDSHYPCQWFATLNRHVQGYLVYKGKPLAVMGNLNKSLRGFLDTLGVELNAKIIWDAIPFTFVIDWFFGIGGFLDQFSFDDLPLPIECTDCFLQYKETLTIQSDLILDVNSSISTPATVCPPWVTYETFFHRIPIMPNDDLVISYGWRKPSANQLINLASLAIVLAPFGA